VSQGACDVAAMPYVSAYDRDRLEQILHKQYDIVARRQALSWALTTKAVRQRTRVDGPWQIVLPGVYIRGRARLNPGQRVVAAFLYAGTAIAVSGPAALAFYGLPADGGDTIDVLVPPSNRRRDAGFARLHRTTVEPRAIFHDGVVAYVPLERAISDAARMMTDIVPVRAVVASAVQRGRVALWQLVRELDAGPTRGSALFRRAIAEVAAGVRSTAEADLLNLIRLAKLPEPLYNPRLHVGDDFLATPDAWWPDFGVAAEVDSKAWHLSPADWERTLERHARMTAQGILVLHFPPGRLRSARREVTAEMRSALARSGGPLPHVRTVCGTREVSAAGGLWANGQPRPG
jgi:hypothetical protein